MLFAGGLLNTPLLTKVPKKTAAKIKIERRGQRFVCGVCKKSFSQRRNCARHCEVHLGNTTCPICKTVLASKEMLTNHMLKHAGKIRCEKCNSTFAGHRKLQRHKLGLKCRRNGLNWSTCHWNHNSAKSTINWKIVLFSEMPCKLWWGFLMPLSE